MRAACRRIATPLARATWPRSCTSPSLTSIIALATGARRLPARTRSGTAGSCTARPERRARTAAPIAPSRPVTKTRSPGRAPDRVTTRAPARPSSVTVTASVRPRVRLPPTSVASCRRAAATNPATIPSSVAGRDSARHLERHHRGERPPAHRGDVAGVHAIGALAERAWREPSRREVHPLDQRVGRDEEGRAADAERGSVIARADPDVRSADTETPDQTTDPFVLGRDARTAWHERAAGAAPQPSIDFTLSKKLFDSG
jgi:hypothetical protein